MVSNLRKEKASLRALRLLDERLTRGDFQEGARLPPERRLAAELGVSRRALREALGHLEAQERIWRGVGQGTFAGRRPAKPLGDLSAIRHLTSPSELMQARLALEPSIAALAAVHATTEDLKEARRCLKKSAGVSGPEAWELWDGALHRAIARAAHNTLIGALFDALNSVRAHTEWGRLRQASLTPDRQRLYTTQHRAVLTAIADRDAEQAAQAMRGHLLTVSKTLLNEWEEKMASPATENAPPPERIS